MDVGLQAISRYCIAKHVGNDEAVTFAALAERCKLPMDDLTRLLRLTMARHVFHEPRPGVVMHTAASRLYRESEGLNAYARVGFDVR